MPISPGLRGQLAGELMSAADARKPVAPLSTRYPALTVDDAYGIQNEIRSLTLADGAALAGHKIGATSEAIRAMFDIDEPDFGFLTDRMLLPDGARIDPGWLISPMVEAEVAFRLGSDLAGESVTTGDVIAGTAEILPVLEILDSRIADWAIRLVDTVADNGSSALVVCGAGVTPAGIDLLDERVTLDVAGQVHTASGRAVLGGPAASVAWLARFLARHGECLRAGETVLAGSWTPAVHLAPDSMVEASFASLGSVSFTMAERLERP